MLLDLLANQPQTDIWHDPVFLTIVASIATIFAGVIGAVVTYWVYRRQRSKKELSYQIISDAPIVNVNKAIENQIRIMMPDGHILQNARLVVLKLRNSGNIAVRRDDYDEPIKFVFEGSEVIGSDILSTEPEELIKSVDKKAFETDVVFAGDGLPISTNVGFQKFLLNPKQAITLTFLLDKAYKKLDVRGRIVDGEIVKDSNKQLSNSYITLVFWLGMSTFLLLSLIVYFVPVSPSSSLLALVLVFLIICFILIGFFLTRRLK